MSRDQWIADEPRIASAVRGVLSRARRCALLVLALALVATGLFLVARVLRPPVFEATLHFRIAEGDLVDPTHAPVPPPAIREYIFNVALSRERVREIMERHRWSSAFLARNPVAAIDDFRDDIAVEVTRNYFIYGRRAWDEPRSAHVSVSLTGGDVDKTRAVLHEIGETILRDQESHRAEHLSGARDALREQLGHARARMEALQERLGRLQVEATGAGASSRALIGAQIATLQVEVAGAIEKVLALEKRSADLGFSDAAERMKLGLVFELFDESVVARAPPLTVWRAVGLGTMAFAAFLALAALLVGGFDDRVYTADDLESHGLPAFGGLPRFPGDEAGSYREREGAQVA